MVCDLVENEIVNEIEFEYLDGGNVLIIEDNIVDESGLGNWFLMFELKVGNYVVVFYDNDWFIGKIFEIDEEDDEFFIIFL